MPKASRSAPGESRSQDDRDGSWLSAAIVESAADAIVAADLHGAVLSWNAGAERLFGYRAEEAIGKAITLVLSPEQIAEGGPTQLRLLAADRLDSSETVRLTKDGRRIAVLITRSPLKDHDGRLIGSVEIAREAIAGNSLGAAEAPSPISGEVSPPASSEQLQRVALAVAPIGMCSLAPDGSLLDVDQSRCEITGDAATEFGRIVQQEALLSALVEQAPTGMYVLDHQFRVLRFNALAAPVFERVQPVIGRDFQEVVESLWGTVVGGEIAKLFRRTLETGERYVAPRFTEQRADLNVEQTYEWEIQRLTLPNGEFGLACYFLDVTEKDRTARLLIENERRFREMIDALPTAVYTTDCDGYLTHFNPAAVALAGRTPELGSDRWCVSWKLSLPDGTPLAHKDCLMATTLDEGRTERGAEVVFERPDGTRIWVMQFPTPIRDSTGRIASGINMLLDITERKQAEGSLWETQDHIRLATEASAVGIWEWNLAAGTVRWDRVMFRLYGLQPTEDLLIPPSTWSNAVLAEDLSGQEELLLEAIRTKAPSTREFRIRRPGEKDCRYIRSMDTVRTNAQGQVEWLLGTNVDITEQKRAEQALHAIETRLRLGMDLVGLAIFEVDYAAESVQLTKDAARLFGLGNTPMVAPLRVFHAAIHPDDREELRRRNEAALDPAGDGIFVMDFRVPLPDGDLRWVRLRGQVSMREKDPPARPSRAVLAVLDTTTERRPKILFARAKRDSANSPIRCPNWCGPPGRTDSPICLTRSGSSIRACSTNNWKEQSGVP
jgi:PAS domain S-box-containing protein